MKKWLGILAVFWFAIMFIPSTASAAVSYPAIRIDGQLRVFDPPSQIVNQRTMVPLRFVIEDDALKGIVKWDAKTNKVTVACKGKSFEFVIGSSRVLINGVATYLDSTPYLYQDRTYLPLRFLAENLGGTVTWNSSKREVGINFKDVPAVQDTAVFAYYYYGGLSSELRENADLFSDIAFRWFETDAVGNLFYEYQDNYSQVLQFARSKGIKTHASVVFMDQAGLHKLLSSKTYRANLINNLYAEVHKNKYDGVNLDFEFIAATDADYFSTFLQELKTRLGSDKELTVAVFARTAKDNWPTGYDYQAIGKIVDRMVVMTYDYSYKTTAAGPVAPLWWVEQVVDYLTNTARIPPSKLLLGMATYGYNWGPGLTTTTVTWDKLNQVKNSYSVTAHFDKASMSPYYTYTDAQGIAHQIWLENEQSLNEKWNVAVDENLGGISFWRIGNGFKDLYKVLEDNLHR